MVLPLRMVSCSTDIGLPLCPVYRFGHTCKFDHSMSSSSSSLSYIPMVSSVTDMPLMPYPLEYSLLSTLALSSSSSDENAQGFTLQAPSKLKTTTQVVALNHCC
ncbi:PREDICTED: zinc finger CCCH domain-containing protein 34-like [Brassica oleracea var. oleracea]|uniref:zinc finger CCCH domain-containing protein 34-like n=1 Tax=Brassica oleracea var. oleracea TaxID=109376 RepID=UPI0006A706FA|nr:PREDICTED: zinc finger CCCH domain-containing protein 34-like [Brassica oleracea var. oleracea]